MNEGGINQEKLTFDGKVTSRLDICNPILDIRVGHRHHMSRFYQVIKTSPLQSSRTLLPLPGRQPPSVLHAPRH